MWSEGDAPTMSDADLPTENGGLSGDGDKWGLGLGDETDFVMVLGERGILESKASCLVFKTTLFS